MDAPVNRRDQRRARVRRDLLAAARAIIAEQGVQGLRVSDVTDRADVGMGSFYGHFTSKDDLVAEVAADAGTEISVAVGAEIEHIEDPAEALAVWALRLLAVCQSDPPLVETLIGLADADDIFEDMVRGVVERVLARGLESGRFDVSDPPISTVIVIASLLATVRAVMSRHAGDAATLGCAESLLRCVGVRAEESRAIAAAARLR